MDGEKSCVETNEGQRRLLRKERTQAGQTDRRINRRTDRETAAGVFFSSVVSCSPTQLLSNFTYA